MSPSPQLSPERLAEAGLKSFENASELIEEAELLLSHKHLSRTVYLCAIAGEELAKCFMSLSAVVNRRVGLFNEKRYKARFRSHREKTGLLHFFEDVFVSPDVQWQPPDIESGVNRNEMIKLGSLYCDFYGSEPHNPRDLISEVFATEALKLGKNRVEHFRKTVCPKFRVALESDVQTLGRGQRSFLKALGIDPPLTDKSGT